MRTWFDAIHERVTAVRTDSFDARQPSWVVRWTMIAGLLAMLAIAAIIVLPVLMVMLVVFLLATAAAQVQRSLSRLFGRGSQGRKNVRVIVRDE